MQHAICKLSNNQYSAVKVQYICLQIYCGRNTRTWEIPKQAPQHLVKLLSKYKLLNLDSQAVLGPSQGSPLVELYSNV